MDIKHVNEGWSWTAESTELMLQLYIERKDRFRDPTIRKKAMWQEICAEMDHVGFTGASVDILDRKMRNMRKTYRTIKEYNRKSGRERRSWMYYAIFEEHFADDWVANTPAKISSLEDYRAKRKKANMSSFEEITCPNTPGVYVDESSRNSLSSIGEDSVTSTPVSKKRKKAHPAEDTYDQRKTLIEMEKQHIRAIENLAEKIQEANNIQRERNELLKQFIEQSYSDSKSIYK